MRQMRKSLGSFRAALLIGWIVLGAAGLLYARWKAIPQWAAVPVLAAFLLEYLFYLAPGFEAVRESLAATFQPLALAFALAGTALAPYLIYSVGTHQFHWDALARLAALAFTVSLWYIVLPPARAADVLFLLLLASVVLRKFFDGIFLAPVPGLRLEVLGQLMLIRLATMEILLLRHAAAAGFGFLPSRDDWAIGLRNFLLFLPLGFPLALLTGLIHFTPGDFVLWKTIGTFFGILWVVALSEEFFFRGLLQQWLCDWTGSTRVGLAATSIAFGLCHLWFRQFPNWKMALVATASGWFCGRAFLQARSIRAGMVTHALVVTAWRSVFS